MTTRLVRYELAGVPFREGAKTQTPRAFGWRLFVGAARQRMRAREPFSYESLRLSGLQP